MKSLVFILCFLLMPFSVSANSFGKDSTLSTELDEVESLLWAELAVKDSILSAISVMEKTNDTLGLNPPDSFLTALMPVPVMIVSIMLIDDIEKIAKLQLEKLPDREQFKTFLKRYKTLLEKEAYYQRDIKFYNEKFKFRSLYESNFAKEIQEFSIEELSEKGEELVEEMASVKKDLKNNPENIKLTKKMDLLAEQKVYVNLKKGLAESEQNLKDVRLAKRIHSIIRTEYFGFSYKSGAAIRQAGMKVLPLAGFGVYAFIGGDALFIAMPDEAISQLKEQYTEDVENLKRVLLPQ